LTLVTADFVPHILSVFLWDEAMNDIFRT